MSHSQGVLFQGWDSFEKAAGAGAIIVWGRKNHAQRANWYAVLTFQTYIRHTTGSCCTVPSNNGFNPYTYSAGIDFTSVDVRVWRLKSIPAL